MDKKILIGIAAAAALVAGGIGMKLGASVNVAPAPTTAPRDTRGPHDVPRAPPSATPNAVPPADAVPN